MTHKRQYLAILERQTSAWVQSSLLNPSRHMSRTHVALHLIALRNRGEA